MKTMQEYEWDIAKERRSCKMKDMMQDKWEGKRKIEVSLKLKEKEEGKEENRKMEGTIKYQEATGEEYGPIMTLGKWKYEGEARR